MFYVVSSFYPGIFFTDYWSDIISYKKLLWQYKLINLLLIPKDLNPLKQGLFCLQKCTVIEV